MNASPFEDIVNAVLYEGYILYPYRASSRKNRRERFTFGRVYPKAYSDSQKGAEPWMSQTQCLVHARGENCAVKIAVRFLQPMWREVGVMTGGAGSTFSPCEGLVVNGTLHQSWQEATEREVAVQFGSPQACQIKPRTTGITFPASSVLEPFTTGSGGTAAATRRRQEAVRGTVEAQAELVGADLFKITVRVSNSTPLTPSEIEDQDAVLMRTFASTHTLLTVTGGEFISLLDPPAEVKSLAADCKNIGTWPVLVGDESKGQCDAMLSSPIILYDYPRIAPESAGNFFDGTEIDEMLTLRVLTMTDREKAEMRGVDDFARRILERAEAAGPEDLMKMHGVLRDQKQIEEFFNPARPRQSVQVGGQELSVGDNVRIRPKKRADAMDMMLAGKTALIEAIEEDAEGQVHLAVVLEDDPGRDLGMARQPGHRFFYSIDEVEPLEGAAP